MRFDKSEQPIDLSISKDNFYSDYFEKDPYLARRAIATEIIGWSKISDIVHASNPDQSSEIRIFMNGPVPFIQYAEKYQDLDVLKYRLLTDRVIHLLSSGATVVLNRLDLRDRSIAHLCRAISEKLSLRVVANGYLAYGGTGTFGKHWDTHDVFACQLLGRKLWRIYPPTFSLPLNHQKSKNFKKNCPLEPTFESVLDPGDVLYIPRGWWHEAIPLENQETFHIAAGAHTAKLVDYLDWILHARLPDLQIARSTVQFGEPNHSDLSQFISTLCEELLSSENQKDFQREMGKLLNKFEDLDLNPRHLKQNQSFNHNNMEQI